MNWKQAFTDYLGYKDFADIPTDIQDSAEKAVEFYQNELNDQRQNEPARVSGLSENSSGKTGFESEEKRVSDKWANLLKQWEKDDSAGR